MARVKPGEIEAWLSDDRFTVTGDDLIEQIEERVLSRLENRFDTSAWLDVDTTPDLVRQVIALLNAAYILRKAYSDQEDSIPYADSLSDMAESMLMELTSGTMNLTVGDVVVSESDFNTAVDRAGPAFFPTDTERLDDDGDHVIKFKMGDVF